MKRQQTPRPTSPDELTLPAKVSRTRRSRKWEQDQRNLEGMCTVTFRHIPEDVRDKINSIAQELYVNRDDVARYLLEWALESFIRGEIELQPTLENGKLTLFPKPTQENGNILK